MVCTRIAQSYDEGYPFLLIKDRFEVLEDKYM
jgi:hypothetical protein